MYPPPSPGGTTMVKVSASIVINGIPGWTYPSMPPSGTSLPVPSAAVRRPDPSRNSASYRRTSAVPGIGINAPLTASLTTAQLGDAVSVSAYEPVGPEADRAGGWAVRTVGVVGDQGRPHADNTSDAIVAARSPTDLWLRIRSAPSAVFRHGKLTGGRVPSREVAVIGG